MLIKHWVKHYVTVELLDSFYPLVLHSLSLSCHHSSQYQKKHDIVTKASPALCLEPSFWPVSLNMLVLYLTLLSPSFFSCKMIGVEFAMVKLQLSDFEACGSI